MDKNLTGIKNGIKSRFKKGHKVPQKWKDSYSKIHRGKHYSPNTEFKRRITEQTPKVDEFNYDFLLSQKATLEANLAEVNGLIAEADKVGVLKAEDVIKEI